MTAPNKQKGQFRPLSRRPEGLTNIALFGRALKRFYGQKNVFLQGFDSVILHVHC